MSIYLRKANELDKKTVYTFANDAETRRQSFSQEPISWETHCAWYQDLMTDSKEETPKRYLWMAMNFLLPVGDVRLQIEGEKGLLSYVISPESRGLGYGKKMLHLLEKEIRSLPNAPKYLVAQVKPENVVSCSVFEALGYEKQEEEGVICFTKQLADCEQTTKKAKAQEKKREPGFEILRVLAMLMIITLHYLSKGHLLPEPLTSENFGPNLPYFLLEALCLGSVNVYVLIAGYFLCQQKFRLSKLVSLWLQVFFYSVGVPLVLGLLHLVDLRQLCNLYELQFYLLPAMNGHYWFASAYLGMLMFAPFLAAGTQQLSKKTHGILLALLFTYFCIVKSILPFAYPYDDLGNGILWFLCLLLLASYIRSYGFGFFDKGKKGLLLYVLSVAGILLSWYVATMLQQQTGGFAYAVEIPTNYNFIFVTTASIGLFLYFKNKTVRENWWTNLLVRIAPYTFGVYLLHEHLNLRYAWPMWLRVGEVTGWLQIVHWLISILLVFVLGIFVDFLRAKLFQGIDKLIIWALKIYYAKREVWDYLIFGALTTLVNWVTYVCCAYFLLIPLLGRATTANNMVSNTLAWIVSVLFAYWTNRNFVFHSEVVDLKGRMQEFLSFVGARIFSFLVEQVLFFFMVTLLSINDLISKLVIGIVVILLNYIFSKLWIFKGKKNEGN